MGLETFGTVRVGKVKTPIELRELLTGVPRSDTYIVKPNWYSPHIANFTDASALDLLLGALPGRAIVVEGYSWDRHDGSMSFSVGGTRVNWPWIVRHPDFSWIREGENLETLRRWDRWFLESNGFTKVLKSHGAEYLNVTEEIWDGRIIDPTDVNTRVEARFSPAMRNEIYSFMPTRLAELEGAPLVSLGRVKGYGGSYPSLTTKNIFGLIPDPLRVRWHGRRDADLSRSIVDIVKVYASYFPLYGVCEAITSFTVSDPNGEVRVPWGNYHVNPCDGFVAVGLNLIELDAVLCGLINIDPECVGYITLGEGEFGLYDRRAVEEAKVTSPRLLPLDATTEPK